MRPRQRAAPAAAAAAGASAATPGDKGVLVDSGVLVALFDRDDAHHAGAQAWLARTHAPLLSVTSVLAEAAFFLPARLRAELAGLASRGVLQLHHPDAAGHARIAQLFEKYADQDPDWAELELVWLAEATGVRRIATLEARDFGVYRIHGRRRFELEWLR